MSSPRQSNSEESPIRGTSSTVSSTPGKSPYRRQVSIMSSTPGKSPSRRPFSAVSVGSRGQREFVPRPWSGRSEPAFKLSNCGVPILQTDPERDALLIKQYQEGLAKRNQGRLTAYQKYLPNLTVKEKTLLGITQIPKIQETLAKTAWEYNEVAERENMDVLTQHSEREHQVEKNLLEINEATATLKKNLHSVNKKCRLKTKEKVRARQLEDMSRKEAAEMKEKKRQAEEDKLRHMTYEYFNSRREKEMQRSHEIDAKMSSLRSETEMKHAMEEERERMRRSRDQQINKEMKDRCKLTRDRIVDSTRDIQQLKEWEVTLKELQEKECSRRKQVKEASLNSLRDRQREMKEKYREVHEKAAKELEAKKAAWRKTVRAQKIERKARDEKLREQERQWAKLQRQAMEEREERVNLRRAKYLSEMSRPTECMYKQKTFATQYESDDEE